jgi:hypothetical protein
MKFRYAVFLLVAGIITFCFGLPVHSQSSVRDLEKYMNELRAGSAQTIPISIWQDARNEAKLLKVLTPFYTDTLKRIREKAYYITKRIGQKSKDNAVQQLAIAGTVLALKEKDTGTSGSAIESLAGFRKENFSAAVRDTIDNLLSANTPHLDELLKLAGFLAMQEQVLKIRHIMETNTNAKIKWAARLSLARMGDAAAIASIMKKLNSTGVNDDFVYDIVPDLIYTRQPEIFEFLEKIINSDAQNCQSDNPDSNKKILCGYRVMGQIAPVIDNFPLKTDDSGELIVSDYALALREVREWFASNDSYNLKTNIY